MVAEAIRGQGVVMQNHYSDSERAGASAIVNRIFAGVDPDKQAVIRPEADRMRNRLRGTIKEQEILRPDREGN